MLAYFWMFTRDATRLRAALDAADANPLGAAALAGTTYPLDRARTTELLGFSRAIPNSLDAVSDRDFCIEFCSAASLIMVHISRLSEELIYWMCQRFKFMMLPDRFTTGSSIMPQKKNPDVAETARGKAGRVCGDLISLVVLMKGLPLAYNKDSQEDKEPVFDAIDTVKDTLRGFVDMMPGMEPNRAEMLKAAQAGFPTATDLADYLTKKGLPFRESHDVVGSVVRLASERDCDLAELPLEELRNFTTLIEEDVYEKALKLESCVAARDHVGGTAPNQVRFQVARWNDIFKARHAEPKPYNALNALLGL
jgi:argininosuccinate lyase